jgi:hypothetical protein
MSNKTHDTPLDVNELYDYYVTLEPQFRLYSQELYYNYEQVKKMKEIYDSQLQNILILSRQRDLRRFFRNVEVLLLCANKIFDFIDDVNVKKYVKTVVKNFRNKNLENIKTYISKTPSTSNYLLEVK